MTTYTWTDNAMQGGAACDVDKVNENLMYLKYDVISGLKEYGLNLSNGTDTEHEMDVAAGARWDATYTEPIIYAGGTIDIENSGAGGLDTGSVAASTQYYIWLCKGDSGVTAIFSASATAPTLPSGYDDYKVCIGRVITNGSANIDNAQLWTKHPDGTETYVYTQASGNFPNSDITVTHNLNTMNADVYVLARKYSDSTLYNFASGDRQVYPYNITSANAITISDGGSTAYYIILDSTTPTIAGSASYGLKVVMRTRLA